MFSILSQLDKIETKLSNPTYRNSIIINSTSSRFVVAKFRPGVVLVQFAQPTDLKRFVVGDKQKFGHMSDEAPGVLGEYNIEEKVIKSTNGHTLIVKLPLSDIGARIVNLFDVALSDIKQQADIK
jgi:hypothetical protein